jgi:hypothetical protein
MTTRDTSRQAYHQHDPETVDGKILGYLHDFGDATDDQLEHHLGLSHQTCSANRRHLVERGAIRATDRKRKTCSGRSATVWELVPPAVVVSEPASTSVPFPVVASELPGQLSFAEVTS